MENTKFEIRFADENIAYTGEHGPCMFINGKTETRNPWFAAWFEGNGFKVNKIVEEPKMLSTDELSSMKVDELKALADEKGIEYDSKAKKEDLIQLLEGAK